MCGVVLLVVEYDGQVSACVCVFKICMHVCFELRRTERRKGLGCVIRQLTKTLVSPLLLCWLCEAAVREGS